MLLKDIPEGASIGLIASSKIDTLKFETEIIKVSNTTVLLKPILSDGLLVNFKANGVVINLMCSRGTTDYVFKNVVIDNAMINGKYCHVVSASVYGERVNRRETPRYIINRQCVFTPGPNRLAENAILRDISMTGVSIVSTLRAKVGDTVSISYHVPQTTTRIPLTAKVVRVIEDTSTNRYLYGCQLVKENRVLNRYIMSIQRSRIQLTGRRATI